MYIYFKKVLNFIKFLSCLYAYIFLALVYIKKIYGSDFLISLYYDFY